MQASLPPFRLTSKVQFNPDTGTMETVPVEKSLWSDVAGDFFERQAAWESHHEETLARLEAERQERMAAEAAAMLGVPKLNTAYKFTHPLPDFYERQRIAEERRHMPYEERIAEYEAKYGPRR